MKCYIGVEMGYKNMTVGIVDKYGKLIKKDSRPTIRGASYEELVRDMVSLISKVLDSENIEMKSVKYIGLACPGMSDNQNGLIVKNKIFGFSNVPIRSEIQKYIPIPVYIENDASCAALAESVAGAAEDIEYSLTLKIDHTISGGIIIYNKIYSGFNSTGPEFGHMVINYSGTQECNSDGSLNVSGHSIQGYWNQYASSKALINQIGDAMKEDPSSKMHEIVGYDCTKIDELTVLQAVQLDDPTAIKVFNQYIDYLAIGISTLINVLVPEVIIISGDISKLGDALIKPLAKAVRTMVLSDEITIPEFKIAEMGNAAVIIGAAMLGLHKGK